VLSVVGRTPWVIVSCCGGAERALRVPDLRPPGPGWEKLKL
jgi:hypothetical protein